MAIEFDCVIIGAGAAGLMAAIESSKRGKRTLLLEKNTKPGVKILMSGGTRCNLTQNTDTRGIISEFGPNGRFLHSALAAFSNEDLVTYFNQRGLPTKVEKTGKIFPQSDRAKDVLDVLVADAEQHQVYLNLAEPVELLEHSLNGFHIQTPKAQYVTSRVLITTGGRSYPGCGTTGDGYQWCRAFGHTIVDTYPALAPLKTPKNSWTRNLQGVTLPELGLTIFDAKQKAVAKSQGSTLFTHVGVSGPSAMNISKYVSTYANADFTLAFDLLPSLNLDQKQSKLQKLITDEPRKQIDSVLKHLFPSRVVEVILEQSQINTTDRCAEIGKAKIRILTQTIHSLQTPVTGTLGFEKAEVTAGGVSLLEVDSKTMESKCLPGLYLAGEILDLDGPIGGYNFTAAFATGFLAGQHL